MRSWRAEWAAALGDGRFRIVLALTAGFVVTSARVFAGFVTQNEHATGPVLDDPVLRLLPPIDLTWPIFVLIYASVIAAIVHLSFEPWRLLRGLWTWCSMILLRMLTMALVPIDPPVGCIRLVDPFTELIFGTSEAPIRDLFFSGHTSTMFILWLMVRARWRPLLVVAGVGVATGVVVMRAHYTIDVVAAPFFVYPLHLLYGWVFAKLAPPAERPG